jgi:alanine dehydrogenase
MIIGVPKEIKNNENRVALTPSSAQALIQNGHQVVMETEAGIGSGFFDTDYEKVGCELLSSAKEVWTKAEMILKVKEPIEEEYLYFREDLILFTFLHLAAEPKLAEALIKNKVTAISYETLQLDNGMLPLLTPMSEVAGRMSVQIGSQFLQKNNGGKGVLLGGVPGVLPAHVVIIGGGIVGTNAAKMAIGLGAKVTIIDKSAERLRYLDDVFGGRVHTLMSNSYNVRHAVRDADLLIGAVLVPGAKAPNLVTEDMVQEMGAGSVIVDVAIDQGGSIETIDRITTHDNPTYEKYGVIHYSVANMPGAVPRTSTIALTNVTLPYATELANKGLDALQRNPALKRGLNVYQGHITYESVATSLHLPFTSANELFENVKNYV